MRKGGPPISTVTDRPRASALSTPTESSASGRNRAELSRQTAVHAVFMDITRTLGVSFVPDLFVGMSDQPAYLEAAWELFKEDLGLDSLDCRTRHIMALAITTNEAGVYCIAAYPHAFRLHALDHATCDKVLLTIRFFKAFDRYLSGVMPADVTETTEFVGHCLRDEYQSYEATKSSEMMFSREENQPVASLICGILIMGFFLIPIVASVYLFLR